MYLFLVSILLLDVFIFSNKVNGKCFRLKLSATRNRIKISLHILMFIMCEASIGFLLKLLLEKPLNELGYLWSIHAVTYATMNTCNHLLFIYHSIWGVSCLLNITESQIDKNSYMVIKIIHFLYAIIYRMIQNKDFALP